MNCLLRAKFNMSKAGGTQVAFHNFKEATWLQDENY